MIKLLEKLFCKHTYEEIPNTRHMVHGGMDKKAEFKCTKCDNEIYCSIFSEKVNNYD